MNLYRQMHGDMSRTEFAAHANVTYPTAKRWETLKEMPNYPDAKTFAREKLIPWEQGQASVAIEIAGETSEEHRSLRSKQSRTDDSLTPGDNRGNVPAQLAGKQVSKSDSSEPTPMERIVLIQQSQERAEQTQADIKQLLAEILKVLQADVKPRKTGTRG